MVLYNFRKQLRRLIERRKVERRILGVIFMSPEWLIRIREENLLWPKSERRIIERRSLLRRQNTRRLKNVGRKVSQPTSQQDLLTQEEKQLLKKLVQQGNSE